MFIESMGSSELQLEPSSQSNPTFLLVPAYNYERRPSSLQLQNNDSHHMNDTVRLPPLKHIFRVSINSIHNSVSKSLPTLTALCSWPPSTNPQNFFQASTVFGNCIAESNGSELTTKIRIPLGHSSNMENDESTERNHNKAEASAISLYAHPLLLRGPCHRSMQSMHLREYSVWYYVIQNAKFPVGHKNFPHFNEMRFLFSVHAKEFSDKYLHRHRGRWTRHEEEYAQYLIALYGANSLRLPRGISLRRFLALSLRCNPMRISKKFPMLQSLPTTFRVLLPLEKGYPSFLAQNETEENTETDDILRRGRWTIAEEIYATAVVKACQNRLLELPWNISCRRLLALLLRCSRMRVSKKLTTMVFKTRKDINPDYTEERRKATLEKLYWLELEFLHSIYPSKDFFGIV